MSNPSNAILRISLLTALGLTGLAGCASNSSQDSNRFAGNCDAATMSQMKYLNDRLEEAIHRKSIEWTPAEAQFLQSELKEAMDDCNPQTATTVIAKAEPVVSEYDRRLAEAERKREQERLMAEKQQANQENLRYLAMARKEWAQVVKYDNLTEDQQEEKSDGRMALNQEEGRKAYNILNDLHAELRDRMEQYTVNEGDTLWDIAASSQAYNNPWQWPAIYDENRNKIEDPDLIYPGQTLSIDPNAPETELTMRARENNIIR